MTNTINKDQLASLRSRLEERHSQLRTALQDEKITSVRTDSDSQDIEQSYASDMDQQVDVELNEQHSLELRSIVEALQRMDAGHYGVCQDCGASIGIERLEAYPMARRCIDCKQAFEQEPGIARHS